VQKCVDENHVSLETELQALLRRVRERLVKEEDDHYQPLITSLERKLAEQTQKNTAELKRGQQLDDQLGRTLRVIDNLMDCIAGYRHKDQTANLRSKVFKAWRTLTGERDKILRVMTRSYVEQPSQRIMFRRWLRRMRKVRLNRQKRELRLECEQNLRTRESAAKQRIAALQAELDAVRQSLVEHEEQHDDMQQKLRRAFMRGVVGLNLEAMDVFGEVPTSEALRAGRLDLAEQRDDDDREDFFVEPAPKVSVLRHN
jgi:hypothetical protein